MFRPSRATRLTAGARRPLSICSVGPACWEHRYVCVLCVCLCVQQWLQALGGVLGGGAAQKDCRCQLW